jgi:hypothetical protein
VLLAVLGALEWRLSLVKRSVKRPGGVAICAGRLAGLDASSRRSSEMASDWRSLCPAVDCGGLVMMARVVFGTEE